MAIPFPGYAITILFVTGANAFKVSQIELQAGEEAAARYTFAALAAAKNTVSATLEGPDGVVLAEHGLEWEPTT